MNKLKKLSMIFISLTIIVLGFVLHIQSAFDEVKKSSDTTFEHIFSPVDSISSNPYQTISFDEDAYYEEGIGHIVSLSFTFIDFEKALSTGITYLVAGFTLLIFTTRENLANFFKSIYNLAF